MFDIHSTDEETGSGVDGLFPNPEMTINSELILSEWHLNIGAEASRSTNKLGVRFI